MLTNSIETILSEGDGNFERKQRHRTDLAAVDVAVWFVEVRSGLEHEAQNRSRVAGLTVLVREILHVRRRGSEHQDYYAGVDAQANNVCILLSI